MQRRRPDSPQMHSNISVYVRCRSRNEREISEKSGVVVSTMGLNGKQVVLNSHKTYQFDKVFGVESDQEFVFDTVAKNYIAEMIQGYNCTVFAYGQTGTGKTYTMSGEMSILGNATDHRRLMLSENAGIIPRTLCEVFQQLGNHTNEEYAVKVSFIELYNEELRDLLDEEDKKLKIYDDKMQSIVVQGMEEIYIKNAAEGLKLLAEGSFKRQVASTKCNDLSSRSHTVFTITTHTKRKDTRTGQEFVKVGKLNLVDLAGSENISRSGAENKRAREAGMINQSLLTLGRVINALVDGSQHIPYRESKLTRLLQDSLGGKTKTCIIATISPAKVSLEETMSTLEYAHRAKSIKNRPQVNHSMSKSLLIGDYVQEIQQLKEELKTTRARHGVYITEENLEKLTNESESLRILTEEQQAKIQVMEEQIKRFKSKFEEQVELLTQSDQKVTSLEQMYDEVAGKLGTVKDTLLKTSEELVMERLLNKEYTGNLKVIKRIHSDTVANFDAVVGVKNELKDAIKQRDTLLMHNQDELGKQKTRIGSLSQQFATEAERFSSQQQQWKTEIDQMLHDKVNQVTRNVEQKLRDVHDIFTSQFYQRLELLKELFMPNGLNGLDTLSAISINHTIFQLSVEFDAMVARNKENVNMELHAMERELTQFLTELKQKLASTTDLQLNEFAAEHDCNLQLQKQVQSLQNENKLLQERLNELVQQSQEIKNQDTLETDLVLNQVKELIASHHHKRVSLQEELADKTMELAESNQIGSQLAEVADNVADQLSNSARKKAKYESSMDSTSQLVDSIPLVTLVNNIKSTVEQQFKDQTECVGTELVNIRNSFGQLHQELASISSDLHTQFDQVAISLEEAHTLRFDINSAIAALQEYQTLLQQDSQFSDSQREHITSIETYTDQLLHILNEWQYQTTSSPVPDVCVNVARTLPEIDSEKLANELQAEQKRLRQMTTPMVERLAALPMSSPSTPIPVPDQPMHRLTARDINLSARRKDNNLKRKFKE